MQKLAQGDFSLKRLVALPLVILIAFITVLYAQAAFAESTLKVGGDCTYPPFTYKDAKGELKGFDIDIANEIAHRLDMKMEHQCVAWDGLLPGLMVGKYDAIIAAMDVTPERAKRVSFSVPYYRAPSVFVGNKSLENAPVNDKNQFTTAFTKGKSVGILRASIYEKYLKQTYPDLKLVQYDTIDDALLDLKAGRVELVFTDMPKVQSDFLDKPGSDDFAVIGPKVDDYKILGEGSAVAINKRNKALLEKVNKAINEMMADGTYNKIAAKYWSFSVKP